MITDTIIDIPTMQEYTRKENIATKISRVETLVVTAQRRERQSN